MFAFLGGGETTNDDVEAQQLQKAQEENEATGFQLVPSDEKKGKSVSFDENKSIQEDWESIHAGDKPKNTKLSFYERFKSVFIHCYIGEIRVDLEELLKYEEISNEEKTIEMSPKLISSRKKREEKDLGDFKASFKISRKFEEAGVVPEDMMSPPAPSVLAKD